jgi:hypothetical protein
MEISAGRLVDVAMPNCHLLDCAISYTSSYHEAFEASLICRCLVDENGVSKVPNAIEIQPQYSPSVHDQNSGEPQFVQN